MQIIKTPGAHKLPRNVEIRNIHNIETESELDSLLEVITPEPTLIFCNSKSKVERVCEFLRSKDVKNLPFFDD
jgi:superfamily II DNA/RNA helicase